MVFSQFSGNRNWYFKLHLDIAVENFFDCPKIAFGYPVLGVSTFTAGFYSPTWVHNIHCLFTVIWGDILMFRERCSFCSENSMDDERCGVVSGFESIKF
jgi:hypothetical protein